MKTALKIFRISAFSLLALLVLLICAAVFILQISEPWTRTEPAERYAYDRVFADIPSIGSANPRIVDLAMLGSHDAFSHAITAASPNDPAENGSLLNNAAVSALARGFKARYSAAQAADAWTQLSAGVRYFDVRLSLVDGVWWTKHGSLSAPFEDSLRSVLEFLDTYAGEFVILDFQHFFLDGETCAALLDYLETVTVNGKNIYDYVPYATTGADEIPLGRLRYNDVTANGGGAVLLLPDKSNSAAYPLPENHGRLAAFYDRAESMRSVWHDSNDEVEILDAIKAETVKAADSSYADMLRVNQTQRSVDMTGIKGICQDIAGWSLLRIAETHNLNVLNLPDFRKMLAAMPIFMVDNATSVHGDFNAKINRAIADYNRDLCA